MKTIQFSYKIKTEESKNKTLRYKLILQVNNKTSILKMKIKSIQILQVNKRNKEMNKN
jgi:hypothetical protein